MRSGTPVHFFGSRQNGENASSQSSAWRYGKGNVFSPSTIHAEYSNAAANIDAVMKEFNVQGRHPGVILQSQYGGGITVVDEDFLNTSPIDAAGRIIVNADGLFSTLKDIPLLNKSGDAHSIIFESDEAIGILVGAWKCLGQNIIQSMLNNFLRCNIGFDKVTVHIGPGLGKKSYSIGKPTYKELDKVFGNSLEQAVSQKIDKKSESKYVLDVHALLNKYSEEFGFKIDVSESRDTFDKEAWKKVKKEALEKNDPTLSINYYANTTFFSARLYVRADRMSRRICQSIGLILPTELADEPGKYNDTGRCLNGVMRR